MAGRRKRASRISCALLALTALSFCAACGLPEKSELSALFAHFTAPQAETVAESAAILPAVSPREEQTAPESAPPDAHPAAQEQDEPVLPAIAPQGMQDAAPLPDYAPEITNHTAYRVDPAAFSDADRELMDSAFQKKGWTLYEPSLSDPVKSDIREDVLKARGAEFFDLWLRVGRQEPKVYADAFFSLILPSVYPYSHYRVAQPYIETGLQPGVLTAPFGQPPMTQPSRFEAARKSRGLERSFKNAIDPAVYEALAQQLQALAATAKTEE